MKKGIIIASKNKSYNVIELDFPLSRDSEVQRTGGKMAAKFRSWYDALCNQKSNAAQLHSGTECFGNPIFRYEMAVHTPIRLKSPASHWGESQHRALPLSLKVFISGKLAAGWISFIRAQHKGSRYNVAACAFRRFCVQQYARSWRLMCAIEMIPNSQNRIIAAASANPTKAFCVSQKAPFCVWLYVALQSRRKWDLGN